MFSLDAFVAFTLALIAIYSIIFFSSIPSAYYNSLTQAHYLSKDTLLAITQTTCTYPQCRDTSISVLDWIVFRSDDARGDVDFFIGNKIPAQFGYAFEISDDGGTWTELYNTASAATLAGDMHNKNRQKLSVSSYAIAFEYRDRFRKAENPYKYMTCNGEAVVCEIPRSLYDPPAASIKMVRLTVFI